MFLFFLKDKSNILSNFNIKNYQQHCKQQEQEKHDNFELKWKKLEAIFFQI